MKKVYLIVVIIVIGSIVAFYFNPWSTIHPESQKEIKKESQKELKKEFQSHSYKGLTIHEEKFFLENPLTHNLQRVHMYYTTKNAPALLIAPGGGGSSNQFTGCALEGASDFVVFTFDPLGRGESQGEENFHGKNEHAFFYELYTYAKINSNGSVSVASFSFGIAIVSGALATYDMPVDVWVDWEGPHERTVIAHLCLENRHDLNRLSLEERRRIRKDMQRKILEGNAPGECSNDKYWAEREAYYLVEDIDTTEIGVYHRLQGKNDHVHGPFYDHGLEMVNKMTQLGFTTRLNDGPENMVYTQESIVKFLYGHFDRIQTVLDIIREFYF
ncbi:MAG: hypothetical protein PVF58_02605 [Candidatus Methanofastidiosia archaeon]